MLPVRSYRYRILLPAPSQGYLNNIMRLYDEVDIEEVGNTFVLTNLAQNANLPRIRKYIRKNYPRIKGLIYKGESPLLMADRWFVVGGSLMRTP